MRALLTKKWSPFSLKALMVAFYLIGSPGLSFSKNTNCSEWDGFRSVQLKKPGSSSSIAEWATYQQRVYDAKKIAAQHIYEAYTQDQLEDDFFQKCLLSPQEYDEVQEILPSIFLEQSLTKLKNSRSESIIKFSRIMAEKIKNNSLILFKLVGHYKSDPAPTDLAGGFHRGNGSIFMNFTKIPANEWLIILIHELTHSLDVQLSEAIREYSKNETIVELARARKNLNQLTADETNDLYRWLRAGFDRGFLAEYRAWTVTFKIYQEGLDEGLWTSIPWIENILSQKSPHESLENFTFRYLDPRFTNPLEWPFQESPVKEALENLRYHWRQPTTPRPSLKNLELILK